MSATSKLDSHWRLLHQSDYLCAADLRGRTARVRIKDVSRKDLNQEGTDETTPKVVLTFEGKAKTFVANKTNLRALAAFLKTPLTAEWIGRDVYLQPTSKEWKAKDRNWTGKGIRNPQTNQVEDAIRVWPVAPPNAKGADPGADVPAHDQPDAPPPADDGAAA